MNIQSVGGIGPINPVDPAKRVGDSDGPSSADGSPDIQDTKEISDEAKLVQKAQEDQGVRSDKVRELQELIQNGEFETEERMEALADKLVDNLLPTL